MITIARPEAARRVSAYAPPAAVAFASVGGALLVAAAIDLTDGATDAIALGLVGLASVMTAMTIHVRCKPPPSYRTSQALTVLTVVWATFIGVGTVALAFTDVFQARGGLQAWTSALFESTSGFTTTGMTSLPVVEEAGHGVLIFRATSNWLGGLAAVVATVAVLPFVTRTRDLVDIDHRQEAARRLAPSIDAGVRNVMRVYVGFTVATIAAFVATGIGVFDSLAYALAVVSTGGFAPHSTSLWFEQNPAAEWVAIIGMLLAGTNVAIIWWALRGAAGSIWRSAELRVYAAVVVGAIIVVSIGIAGPDEATVSREAVFAVASAISTTGLVAFDFGGWGSGAQILLVLLLAMGPMSASIGAGFRILRVMVLWEVARRELVRMVYPRAVHVVKLGGRPVADGTARSIAGHLVLYLGVVLGGAYAVGLFEGGVRLSLVTSVSAVSTSGLLLGVRAAHELSDGARLVLIPLMVAGRLAILPLFVSVERGAARAATLGRRLIGRANP